MIPLFVLELPASFVMYGLGQRLPNMGTAICFLGFGALSAAILGRAMSKPNLTVLVAAASIVLTGSILAAGQEPSTALATAAAATPTPCVPSIEALRALAWPISALVIAILFRRPLAAFVGALGSRVTKLSLFKVELELVPATPATATSTPLLDDIKTATTSAPISDSSRMMLDQVQTNTPADYAVIDLGTGGEWLTSRLFIAAAMLERMRSLQVMVFQETTASTPRRFLAIAPGHTVRWSLAQRYPHLEAAWARAYIQAFPGAPSPPIFTSTGSGRLLGNCSWRVLPLVGANRKLSWAESAIYTLTAATGAGRVEWKPDPDEAVTGYEIYRSSGSDPKFYLEGTVSDRLTTTFLAGLSGASTSAPVATPRVLQELGVPALPEGAVWLPDMQTTFQPMITSNTGAMDPLQARQIVARFIDSLQRPTTIPYKPASDPLVEPLRPPAGWTRVGDREERAGFVDAELLRAILPPECFSAWSDAFDDAPRAKRARAVLRRISPFVALTRGDREFVRLVNRKALVEDLVGPLADEPEAGS
jgi:hypothetical protein